MQSQFDPHPQLARYLHARVCPGHRTEIDPVDCLLMPSAMADFQAELAKAGLSLVPTKIVQFLMRSYDGAIADATPAERAPASGSEQRAIESTFVAIRLADGTTRRDGPYPRWMAELVIGDLAWSHADDVVGARLEREPSWIASLLDELGGGPIH